MNETSKFVAFELLNRGQHYDALYKLLKNFFYSPKNHRITLDGKYFSHSCKIKRHYKTLFR